MSSQDCSDSPGPSALSHGNDAKDSAGSSPKDVERSTTATTSVVDPYNIRNGLKSGDELASLRQRKTGKKGKQLERYHLKQNELIDNLLKPMEVHTQEAKDTETASRLAVRIAVNASLAANICLSGLQIFAAVSSLSLSFFATALDSVFDPMSNVMLYYLHRRASRLDVAKWPVGGSRLESIGNIVYGFLMGSVNLVIIVESFRSIATHGNNDKNTFDVPALIAVGVSLGVKIILFIYCFSIRKHSSQVQVLWEDHRNDLWVNGFGLLMSAGGSKLRWYLDPMGAIIIGTGISISWGLTVYKEFELLAGKSAPYEFIQLLIYNAATFNDEIEKVDTVRAYHSGPDYFVEIDVVMDANTPLWKAHNISQQLQDRIEVLPNVDRAFVHVDHETTHTPEHRKYT